jgi:hypothetical protein
LTYRGFHPIKLADFVANGWSVNNYLPVNNYPQHGTEANS